MSQKFNSSFINNSQNTRTLEQLHEPINNSGETSPYCDVDEVLHINARFTYLLTYLHED